MKIEDELAPASIPRRPSGSRRRRSVRSPVEPSVRTLMQNSAPRVTVEEGCSAHQATNREPCGGARIGTPSGTRRRTEQARGGCAGQFGPFPSQRGASSASNVPRSVVFANRRPSAQPGLVAEQRPHAERHAHASNEASGSFVDQRGKDSRSGTKKCNDLSIFGIQQLPHPY